MEKKFVIPATTMLLGIAVWLLLLFILNWEESGYKQELMLGSLVGGLIIFSASACRKAGGPRAGNVFRAILLTVLAILSYFFVGSTSAITLLGSAIIIGIIALNTKNYEIVKDSVSKSA